MLPGEKQLGQAASSKPHSLGRLLQHDAVLGGAASRLLRPGPLLDGAGPQLLPAPDASQGLQAGRHSHGTLLIPIRQRLLPRGRHPSGRGQGPAPPGRLRRRLAPELGAARRQKLGLGPLCARRHGLRQLGHLSAFWKRPRHNLASGHGDGPSLASRGFRHLARGACSSGQASRAHDEDSSTEHDPQAPPQNHAPSLSSQRQAPGPNDEPRRQQHGAQAPPQLRAPDLSCQARKVRHALAGDCGSLPAAAYNGSPRRRHRRGIEGSAAVSEVLQRGKLPGFQEQLRHPQRPIPSGHPECQHETLSQSAGAAGAEGRRQQRRKALNDLSQLHAVRIALVHELQ
mmetsp:Transcript_20541/g.52207  ORF Transcript_20541/g.52207 Transcript_20541/m.52207 type:complete len:342 (+) Transcript_20541:320-1345(+)